MGLFNKMFGSKPAAPTSITVQSAPLTVCAPFTGTAMPLDKIPDAVFSQGILGNGCGLEPEEETVYAPFDGVVCQTTETKHAIGVRSNDGIELLIHVGMDTVDMQGKGFTCLVSESQKVSAGQPLMKLSLAEIKAAGHPATTAVIISNSDDFASVEFLANGKVEHGAPLLRAVK